MPLARLPPRPISPLGRIGRVDLLSRQWTRRVAKAVDLVLYRLARAPIRVVFQFQRLGAIVDVDVGHAGETFQGLLDLERARPAIHALDAHLERVDVC